MRLDPIRMDKETTVEDLLEFLYGKKYTRQAKFYY